MVQSLVFNLIIMQVDFCDTQQHKSLSHDWVCTQYKTNLDGFTRLYCSPFKSTSRVFYFIFNVKIVFV